LTHNTQHLRGSSSKHHHARRWRDEKIKEKLDDKFGFNTVWAKWSYWKIRRYARLLSVYIEEEKEKARDEYDLNNNPKRFQEFLDKNKDIVTNQEIPTNNNIKPESQMDYDNPRWDYEHHAPLDPKRGSINRSSEEKELLDQLRKFDRKIMKG
jgi:hypothetical protein